MFTDFIPGNGNAANVNITIMVTKYRYHSYIASIAVLLMTLRAGLYVKNKSLQINQKLFPAHCGVKI